MTIDERFERIEHVTAGLAEAQRRDREENRELWRETQKQIAETNAAVGRFAEESRAADQRLGERIEELLGNDRRLGERIEEVDRRLGERIDQMGERIDSLVSAFGEWLRRQSH